MKRTVSLVAAVLVAGACSSSHTIVDYGPSTTAVPGDTQLVAAQVPRASADAAHVPALVAGNRAFAFDLYQRLAASASGQNIVFSPASISNAVAMLSGGAKGETLSQIDRALHFDLPQLQLHAAFNALDQMLAAPRHAAPGEHGAPLKLEQADAVWGQRGYPFVHAYLDLLARDYGAGIRVADFARDAEAERVKINAWVAAATHGKIKELLPKGIVDQYTRMVLVNAIWFKADWVTPFFPRSDPAPFTRLDGSTVQADTMHGGHPSRAVTTGTFDAVELPYVGGASMVVIAPHAGDFADVEAHFADAIQTLDHAVPNHFDEVTMPKFDFSSQFSLADELTALGVRDVFDPMRADLSGMGGAPHDLYLKAVVHQATIIVDEKGTEAAAATGAIAEAMSAPPTIMIDHPFLFVIRDDKTGAVLFAGRVLDPTAR